MRHRSPILALFMLAVFHIGAIGESTVHRVMHDEATPPGQDDKRPGGTKHTETDAARQALAAQHELASRNVNAVPACQTDMGRFAREYLVGAHGVRGHDSGRSVFTTARFQGAPSSHPNDSFIAPVTDLRHGTGCYRCFGNIEGARTLSPWRPLEAISTLGHQLWPGEHEFRLEPCSLLHPVNRPQP